MIIPADILTTFSPITLAEMDEVKLMNRRDTKFVLPVSGLATILTKLQPHYALVNIEGHLYTTYRTLYFDTVDFKLYQKHHSGHLNRYKVRHRTYVETNVGFLEVKFKNNKGRTQKDRIKQKEVELKWTEKSEIFLNKFTPYVPNELMPALWVNYKRITLVGKLAKERVTIDFELEFKHATNTVNVGNMVIVEVKQGTKSKSKVLEILKENKIKEAAISKYCFAAQCLFPELKRNNFKEKIHSIHKILANDKSIQLASNF